LKLTWLIPKEKKFFELLVMESNAVLKGAEALHDLVKEYTDVVAKKNKITEIEHQADDIVHLIFEELNETFVTPIDREDISGLASALDNVLDHIHGAARRLLLYKIPSADETMVRFANTLLKACNELNLAVKDMKKMKNPGKIEERCVEVNRLENVGDEILNYGVVQLFETKEPKDIIKLKEIYEFMESAIDRCEDAANVISDIVIKNR
jgi:predicted phosphate transport protein (TIGR00153 family)